MLLKSSSYGMLSPGEINATLAKLKTKISLEEISDLDITGKTTLKCFLYDKPSAHSQPIIKIQAVLDYTYERINMGNWKDVHPYLRKTMTIASYIKLLAYIKSLEPSEPVNNCSIKEMFQIIDYGLLFGSPLDTKPKLLQECASILRKFFGADLTHCKEESTSHHISEEEQANCNQGNIDKTLPLKSNCTELGIISSPSMEAFYKDYILAEKPIILQDCIDHWPALTRWKNQNYLLKLAGPRTVPVEIGSKYTDSDWTQKLMTLEDFIKDHISSSKGTTGYLAQYQLFDQIPELKQDISEPEYCCFSDTDDPVDVNAWFGPKGTVSPLHHDPKKNLLAQVIGEKRIFLYPPCDSQFLYPHEHELLTNTARVDPRDPDLDLYPKYKNAKGYNCILRPGQMLYIPPKWWHFVESLSISFSVSFWWE